MTMSQPKGFQDKVSLIWSIADILRGDFKPHEYGQTILPFVVLRRLECALEATKDNVIAKAVALDGKIKDLDTILNKEAGHSFYNTSPLTLSRILQDPTKVASNLNSYIRAFSQSASEVIDKFGFASKISKLDEKGLLYQLIGKFADLDLSVKSVPNETMGYIYEELLRKFSEMSNETAGEHYTPREVIRLMVNLLFIEDATALAGQKPIRSIYDPACGTGGMLSVAEEYLHDLNPNITLNVFGQELNDETWAMARSDLMIKGQDPKRITYGNSLTEQDGHTETKFDYCISNPPYGDDWKKYEVSIRREYEQLGFDGRYGAGLPRVSDGSFLFIQHMINKMKPVLNKQSSKENSEGGSRIAIILSGSPMSSGQAGSGESDIRRWILENDWLEAIVAMPDQMFYNTPIGTYVWILSNRKDSSSKGLVRLIDAREMGTKMRKSLGDKKKELTSEAIAEITHLYSEALSATNDKRVKILKNEEFAYARIVIERPLRRIWDMSHVDLLNLSDSLKELVSNLTVKVYDEQKELEVVLANTGLETKQIKEILKVTASTSTDAKPTVGKKGTVEPDLNLRDTVSIQTPLGIIEMDEESRISAIGKAANEYLAREVLPYFPDAWVDHSKTKIGYEIPFTRHFYVYQPPRPIEEIRAEIIELEKQAQELMGELF
jgi:type I restriction enzyme M protein